MTRKEWIEKNLPAYINDRADGGVIGCPRSYRELVRMDPSVLTDNPCKGCHALSSFDVCTECWNQELNVKEERKENMTRREFVIKNYGKEVADNNIFCGIHGCPGHYKKLVDADKSITSGTAYGACIMKPGLLTNEVCAKCWDQEIPGTKKTRPNGFRLEKKEKSAEEPELSVKEAIDRATCDCDTCTHHDLCRFEHQFRGMTKEMYLHYIEETARYNIPELGIQMRPLHCKRYEPTPTIEALDTAVFQLKAQHLTDELIRKIFDEEPKESK